MLERREAIAFFQNLYLQEPGAVISLLSRRTGLSRDRNHEKFFALLAADSPATYTPKRKRRISSTDS